MLHSHRFTHLPLAKRPILAALIKEEHERMKNGKRSVIDEKSGL